MCNTVREARSEATTKRAKCGSSKKMFNLLPHQQRKIIYKEYNSRRIILALNFLNLTGLIALVLLVPPFFLINLKHNASEEEIKNLEAEIPELKNAENLELLASQTMDKIKVLGDSPTLSPLSVWEKIIQHKSAGIKIESFNYTNETAGMKIVIRGTASSREALTRFARSLESEKEFKAVDLPVSSLTRDKNLDFTISFGVGEGEKVNE